MKKNKRFRLLELAGIRHRSDIITEGDDLFGGGDEGGDEGGDDEGGGLFGDDEGGGDDAGGDEGGDEGEDEEAKDDEGEDEEAEKEPEEPAEKLSDKEIADHGPGEIDTEVDSLMHDIFAKSLNTAKVKSQVSTGYPGHQDVAIEESLKTFSMSDFLFEGDEAGEEIPTAETVEAENFDLAYFTGEVARYIKNYETLMDMEGMIYNKAKQFMLSQFGEEMGTEFDEKMKLVHGISFTEEENPQAPIAVGATAGGGGGV